MASIPQYDQRYVVRNGAFRTRTAAISLCIACGDSATCPAYSTINIQQDKWRMRSSTLECSMYKPVITFKDAEGVDGLFCTFRRGLGWFNRLRANDVVKLYDADKSTMIGEGLVDNVFSGSLEQMLSAHAAFNHLIKGKGYSSPEIELQNILKRLYGANYAALESDYSVVYITLIDQKLVELEAPETDGVW